MTEQLKINIPEDRPSANTLRVYGWTNLPNEKAPARFKIADGTGESRTVTLSKNKRRILEGLMKQPMYCASPVRISDIVCILKTDYDINIHMKLYASDRETDRAKYGVYTLMDRVELLDGTGGAT